MHPNHTRKTIGQGKTDGHVCELDEMVQELSHSTNTQDEGVEKTPPLFRERNDSTSRFAGRVVYRKNNRQM